MKIDRVLLFTFVLVLLAMLLRIVLATSVYSYFVDDAYIFMRYSDNFANGQGLVYNPGEKVLGFTSFLYTFILSFLRAAIPNQSIEFHIIWFNNYSVSNWFYL